MKHAIRECTTQTRVAVIGGGKMGEAVLSGWIAANAGAASALSADSFTVVNPGAERREYLQTTYGVTCVADSSNLEKADIVVLSVKPQVMMDVLAVVRTLPFASDALFISVAAGLTTAALEQALPSGAHVVRTMPNTPLLVGAGATTVCGGTDATEEDIALVSDLFGCIGKAFVVREADMDATGAVNGSGPAYVAALIEAMAAGGQDAGLDYEFAEALAAQTVYGTGLLMRQKQQSAEKTRLDVCSPGGTTLAALQAFDEGGFDAAVRAGVKAAVTRSKELGACC